MSVKVGVDRMLENLVLTEDERVALQGDRDTVAQLAQRLADTPTPAGPTPEALGTSGHASIALADLRDSLTPTLD